MRAVMVDSPEGGHGVRNSPFWTVVHVCDDRDYTDAAVFSSCSSLPCSVN
jgi:hypothetical protein